MNTITPSSSPASSLLSGYSTLIAPEVGWLFAPGVGRLFVPGVGRLVPGVGRVVVTGTLPGRITVLWVQNPGISTKQDTHRRLSSAANNSVNAEVLKMFTQHPALLRKVWMELRQLLGQEDPLVGQDDCTLAASVSKVPMRL